MAAPRLAHLAATASAALGAAAALAAPPPAVPSVLLRNAAAPGTSMPYIGLGTGGYGSAHNAYGAYPECWMEIVGCGNYTVEAVKTWLALGGRRLDAADSYDTQFSVGVAMAQSGVAREDIFLLQYHLVNGINSWKCVCKFPTERLLTRICLSQRPYLTDLPLAHSSTPAPRSRPSNSDRIPPLPSATSPILFTRRR